MPHEHDTAAPDKTSFPLYGASQAEPRGSSGTGTWVSGMQMMCPFHEATFQSLDAKELQEGEREADETQLVLLNPRYPKNWRAEYGGGPLINLKPSGDVIKEGIKMRSY